MAGKEAGRIRDKYYFSQQARPTVMQSLAMDIVQDPTMQKTSLPLLLGGYALDVITGRRNLLQPGNVPKRPVASSSSATSKQQEATAPVRDIVINVQAPENQHPREFARKVSEALQGELLWHNK